jgi:segregation and condensation protein B
MEECMKEEQQETLSSEQQLTEEEIRLIEEDTDSSQLSREEPAEPEIDQDEFDDEDADFSEPEIEDSDEAEIQGEVLDEEESDSPEPEQQDNIEESEEPGDESQEPSNELTLESVIEAVLFASDEPLTVVRLASITESTTKQVREHIENLNKKYQENNHAFRIEQIAGGYQMLTLSSYNHWLKKLLRARSETKLSPAAMETLAIIAYKQPVIRADIEAIRGVAVGEVIRSLSYKGLVKIVGRAEILGRPMLYGTTKKFLEVFGLNTLKDLPKIEELKKPPN